jgi:hypothetical protein
MSEFWDEMQGAYASNGTIETYLQNASDSHETVRKLVTGDQKDELKLPLPAGTKVSFITNLDSVLTYDTFPESGVQGTVITVKTASGNTTVFNDRALILWDDGIFRPVLAKHLRLVHGTKQAQSVRIVTSNLGDITSLFASSGSGDELVHKATKDLWSFKKDGDNYVLERLFDNTGKPLKV